VVLLKYAPAECGTHHKLKNDWEVEKQYGLMIRRKGLKEGRS
jgi:hypothetical protein